MHSTYSPSGETRTRLSELKRSTPSRRKRNSHYSATSLEAESSQKVVGDHHRASLVVFPVLAALTWTQCDFSGREIPDWKPVLARADAAWGKGDLHYAKHLYLQAGKFAVWRDDWAGLLAAACGIKKLERERGPYSSTNALLLRAMVAAEKRQSRSGLVAVAKAFAALGEDKVASMVLSLVGKDWVEETNDSADIVSPGCWDK